MKKISLVLGFILSSVYLSAQTAPNDNATSLRGHNGGIYTFTTTGTNDGNVWGGADGTYTDDSRLGKAAVHAGLLQIGQTGNVTITISGGRSTYRGSTRNGISTRDYGAWSGSYYFVSNKGQGNNGQTTKTNYTGNAPENMKAYRGNNGVTYTFTLTGTNDGNVWGGANGIYTDDSKLSTAAVHAGLVGAGQSATVNVTVLPGQSSYKGSSNYGISTRDYGAWSGSYSFGKTGTSNTNTNYAGNAPENMKAYRDNNGSLYTFTVVGTTDGSVWGGANGIYTDDSKLSTAAVHAGRVNPGQTATIRVRVLGAQSNFQGSSRNGITTKDYGSWPGSYRFE